MSVATPINAPVSVPLSDALLDVKLPVALELGRTELSVAELSQLQDGTVLPLDRDLDAPLDVMVNGTVVAHAEVVQVDGKFALRITEVLKNDSQDARG